MTREKPNSVACQETPPVTSGDHLVPGTRVLEENMGSLSWRPSLHQPLPLLKKGQPATPQPLLQAWQARLSIMCPRVCSPPIVLLTSIEMPSRAPLPSC